MKHQNNLKVLRTWRKMSQFDLADASGCSHCTVSDCERGKRYIRPTLKKQFAEVLEVPERMIDGEITIIPKAWDRLVSDPRMPILVDQLLARDSRDLSRMVHAVVKEQELSYAL